MAVRPPPLPERPTSSSHMNINRELLKLMRPGRIGGNRRCADCDAELSDYGNIWASVEQGCFVCVHCLAVHRSLGFRTKSVNMDCWAPEEVERMTAMGNVKVNEIYERYVPGSWSKPTPDAEQQHREQWIMAKYKYRYFMLPHYGEEGVDAAGYQSPNSVSQTLPMRLVDYFVVVGAGELLLEDRVTPSSSPKDIEFREEVRDCFPEADSHLGYPLPEHLPQFVFPDGMRLQTEEGPPTMFHFVLTNSSGLKMHGAALHVTEELDPHDLGNKVSKALTDSAASAARGGGGGEGRRKNGLRDRGCAPLSPAHLPSWLRDTMATPERTGTDERARRRAEQHFPQLYGQKALVLVSHYPFYNLYTQFLQQIYRIGLSEAPLPIERYISNFVCEVPLPPQGQVEVSYALPDRTLTISRPPKNRLPLVDFSYRPLLACLSVENLLCVVGLLLTEAKVALCSSHYALLTPAAEGLVSLLFPFVWQGAYIPVMPFNMKDVLEAPVPFLVGIHSRYLAETPSDHRPQGVVFVDLDNDRVYLGIDEDLGAPRRRPHLPEREASKLRQKLNEFAPAARRARTSHSPATGVVSLNPASGAAGGALLSERAAGGAAVATAAASLASSIGAGVGGGNVLLDGGGGVRGSSAYSLSKVDLAFPNNEHLLPISTFATEQGLTVPSNSQTKSAGFMARVSSHRKHPKKKLLPGTSNRTSGVAVRFGSQESTSMLDPANHTNAADGFSAAEIRAAFLRFFVSVFRGYLAHVVMPTTSSPYPEKLFQKEAFLRSSGHLPESSHGFMNAFLDSQMFERFLEERTAIPPQPEVRFFDESIAAKLNRSKTNPIKKDTPFLNDLSDAHNQVFTPPAPSNWGLPDDGSQYAYGLSFPRLNKDRYGTVRWAKRLFKTPEQHRNVSSANHQRLLSGARIGGRGASVSSGGVTSAGRWSRRKGSSASASSSPTSRWAESASRSRVETAAVMNGLVRLQALYRMHQGQSSFRAKKRAAAVISRAWRNGQATADDRFKLHMIVMLVKDIQRVFRGHLARRAAAARVSSVCKIQAHWRMRVLRRRFCKLRNAAERVQAVARGRTCRMAFLVVRELVILAQATVRGWLERRVAAKQRNQRLKELRNQVFDLWLRASTPLLYRSKFWVLFQGGGFLDLAIHEDEALRLWRDLGLVEHQQEHIARVHFNQTFRYVAEWLRTTRPAISSHPKNDQLEMSLVPSTTSSPGSINGVTGTASKGAMGTPSSQGASLRSRVLRHNSVAGAMKKLGNGANVGLTSGVLSTLGLSGLRRGSTAASAAAVSGSSPANGHVALPGGQSGAVARQAAERVMEERDRLYVELKRETQEGTRVSLFSMFGLERQKKRKRKLADMLWCDVNLADASAEVVLSVFTGQIEARHAWVENKREARIRADLLCTVQACILSLQRLKQHPPASDSSTGQQQQRLPSALVVVDHTRASSVSTMRGARSAGSAASVLPDLSEPESWRGGHG